MKTMLKKFDFLFRVIVLILSISLGAILLFSGAKTALAATLKPEATVEGSVLRVGDIFNNIDEDKASRILGSSPSPGKTMVLDSNILTRIAMALNIAWRPDGISDQVTIKRLATIIDTEQITATLLDSLKNKGISGDFSIIFVGVKPTIILPQDQPAQLDLTKIKFNPSKDTFEATLVAPSTNNPISQLTVAGHIERLVTVPVLKNTLKTGNLIGSHDLDYIEIKSTDVQKDYILEASEIIGMTPRRVSLAGRPIREIDLEFPTLVERGDNVSIILSIGSLELSAQGRSLQNGAKGDLIRVVNTNSNKSIVGTVSGDKEITVHP